MSHQAFRSHVNCLFSRFLVFFELLEVGKMNNLKTERMQPAGVWSVDRASFPSSLEAQLLLFVYSKMDGGKVKGQ